MLTIGYATKPIDIYIAQLRQQGVNVVADVRSVPYSKRFFDYHQDALKSHLQSAGIRYVYLGEELGSRLLALTDTVPDIFSSSTDALQLAYQRQCKACAYRIPSA